MKYAPAVYPALSKTLDVLLDVAIVNDPIQEVRGGDRARTQRIRLPCWAHGDGTV